MFGLQGRDEPLVWVDVGGNGEWIYDFKLVVWCLHPCLKALDNSWGGPFSNYIFNEFNLYFVY